MDSEWDTIARQFDRTRKRPWPEVLEFIEGGGKRGVAVACGNGRHLLPLARRCQEAVGVDRSPAMAAIARRRVEEAGIRNAAVVVADALALPLPPGCCDRVLFIAGLHNIRGRKRRIAALEEVNRVLSPEGEGLISVWAKWQDRFRRDMLRQTLNPFRPSGDLWVPWRGGEREVLRFYHLYTCRELARDCHRAGLHVARTWSATKVSRRHPDNHFAVVTKGREARRKK